ncbi:hypothetical protein PG994_006713 [Apiospora phragmitis]|uniref:Uncharacterized protein n=1 Tax=Apiospora phragmitis TaxID=2905665 RepID=A0ABR1VFW5_9PEZI
MFGEQIMEQMDVIERRLRRRRRKNCRQLVRLGRRVRDDRYETEHKISRLAAKLTRHINYLSHEMEQQAER